MCYCSTIQHAGSQLEEGIMPINQKRTAIENTVDDSQFLQGGLCPDSPNWEREKHRVGRIQEQRETVVPAFVLVSAGRNS